MVHLKLDPVFCDPKAPPVGQFPVHPRSPEPLRLLVKTTISRRRSRRTHLREPALVWLDRITGACDVRFWRPTELFQSEQVSETRRFWHRYI